MPHKHGGGGVGSQLAGAEDVRLVGLVGAAKIANAATTVSGTATRILSENPNRRTAIVRNTGSNTVYLGNEFVSVTNGYPLAADTALVFELSGELYGITEGTSEEVRYMTEGDS